MLCGLLASHQLDLIFRQSSSMGGCSKPDHALRGLRCPVIPQEETSAGLQKVGDVLNVGSEIIQEHLEDVQNGVRLGDLELSKLAVEADVLS